MTRLWPEGKAIHVHLAADGYPQRFIWQDQPYRVQAIQQRWQVDTDWWDASGRVWRDYMAIVTREGLFCVIYQDLLDEQWYLSKVYD